MDNSMLSSWSIDPAFVILGLGIVTLILLIIVIVCVVQIRKLYRRYGVFMRGKDAETLEDTIFELIDEMKNMKAEDKSNKEDIRALSRSIRGTYQKFGMVKYNAFKGMGGNLSFAFALLDMNNTGFVLNSVHSREGCYLYIKIVEKGETEVLLGSEEKEALEQALGY